ncbi:MAG: alginate export family protein [Rhodothermales bacterium]
MRPFTAGLILSIFFISQAAAQLADHVSINAQVRHRFEVSAKDLNSDTDAVTFNLLRTRLGARFVPLEHTEAFIQVQDARVFGEEANTLTDGSADQLDLHQAYVKISNLFDWPLDLQLGRFEANYGPQRLIGAVGWHNIGRSFDGVLVRLHPENVKLDLFNLKLVEQMAPGGTGDLNVLGAYGDFQLIDNYTTQAFAIWQRADPTENLSRYTLGVYLTGAMANIKPEIELAYQGGQRQDIDVSALMVAVNLGYTLAGTTLAPTFSAGIDYLSGDDDPDDGTYKVFDTLYATNHKYYGFMDYFLNLPVHTAGLGLMDVHAKVAVKPRTDMSLRLAYHHFQANEDFVLANGSTSTRFGDEVDLTLVFNYNQRVTFSGGASVFSPGAIFEETRGDDLGAWGYIMTTVNL